MSGRAVRRSKATRRGQTSFFDTAGKFTIGLATLESGLGQGNTDRRPGLRGAIVPLHAGAWTSSVYMQQTRCVEHVTIGCESCVSHRFGEYLVRKLRKCTLHQACCLITRICFIVNCMMSRVRGSHRYVQAFNAGNIPFLRCRRCFRAWRR